jgi:hypothetical protein
MMSRAKKCAYSITSKFKGSLFINRALLRRQPQMTRARSYYIAMRINCTGIIIWQYSIVAFALFLDIPNVSNTCIKLKSFNNHNHSFKRKCKVDTWYEHFLKWLTLILYYTVDYGCYTIIVHNDYKMNYSLPLIADVLEFDSAVVA